MEIIKSFACCYSRAKQNPKRIVFAEADHLNVLKAAQIVYEEGIGIPILLGRKAVIQELMEQLEFDADIQIMDPKADDQAENLTRIRSEII